VIQTQTTLYGRPTPSSSWLKVQNSYHSPQTGKQIQCHLCSTKRKPGKDLNVQNAKCSCILTPSLGCFTPNRSSQSNTSQGKVDYTMVSTIFHYVWIFF